MVQGLHSVVQTKEVGGQPDFFQTVSLTSLYQQIPFSGKLSTITFVNDSSTDQLEISFDGATLAGSVRPGETLRLNVDQKTSVWVRGLTLSITEW